MPKSDYCSTLTTTMIIRKVITPRNRLHSTAIPKPSTLVHICTISAFIFSLLHKIIAEFMISVTGDQQPHPLWTFQPHWEMWSKPGQHSLQHPSACCTHLVLELLPALGARKCQLFRRQQALFGVLEEALCEYSDPTAEVWLQQGETDGERQPACVRYTTKRSNKPFLSTFLLGTFTSARGIKPTL